MDQHFWVWFANSSEIKMVLVRSISGLIRAAKPLMEQSVKNHAVIRHSTLGSEDRNPELAVDIRLIVKPHTPIQNSGNLVTYPPN
jgi:hypothetical protein